VNPRPPPGALAAQIWHCGRASHNGGRRGGGSQEPAARARGTSRRCGAAAAASSVLRGWGPPHNAAPTAACGNRPLRPTPAPLATDYQPDGSAPLAPSPIAVGEPWEVYTPNVRAEGRLEKGPRTRWLRHTVGRPALLAGCPRRAIGSSTHCPLAHDAEPGFIFPRAAVPTATLRRLTTPQGAFKYPVSARHD